MKRDAAFPLLVALLLMTVAANAETHNDRFTVYDEGALNAYLIAKAMPANPIILVRAQTGQDTLTFGPDSMRFAGTLPPNSAAAIFLQALGAAWEAQLDAAQDSCRKALAREQKRRASYAGTIIILSIIITGLSVGIIAANGKRRILFRKDSPK